MNKRRGRPASYVRDRDGRPVVGLSFHKSSGRYYTTHERPPTYFGHDLDVAIMSFRAREAGGKTVVLPAPKPMIQDRGDREASIAEGWITRAAAERLIPWPEAIDEAAIWTWVRRQIIANPRRVAQQVGIPAVAYLADLRPPEPSLTLREVESNYFARRKPMNKIASADQRRHWTEFARIVGAKTVRDITREDIEKYHEQVWKQAKKRKWSSSSIRHRLDAPKTMLRASLKRGRDVEQLRRVIDLMALFERPSAPATDPHPMSRNDLHALLDAASVKMRTAILLALNVAAYPSEVVGIKKAELDLKAKSYVGRRHKTGITRIAVLWDRTVAAVREYMQAEPHDGDALFLNAVGAGLTARSLTQQFRDLRERAGLGRDVRFDGIRDGAYTAAIDGGATIDEARMLAGHKVGIADHYLLRKPSLVAAACAAIEAHYFGPRIAGDAEATVA